MTLVLFAKLLIAHAICDYPLQGDFMAMAKNPAAPLPGVPWFSVMSSHAAIHAGAVWFLTGSPLLGACEFIAHFVIDYAKCRRRISFGADQSLHALCKLVWAAVITFPGAPP